MSIVLNGTEIGSEIEFNNTELSEIVFNGVSVWTAAPPYYKKLKNGQTLTEAEWLEFLDADGIKYIVDKGEESLFLNKKVTVHNSETPNYSIWDIADFNHDNTEYTCDLIASNVVENQYFSSSTSSMVTRGYFGNSDIRYWLNGTYYNGFSAEVKSKIQTMNVYSWDRSYSLNVKILSRREINDENYSLEGTAYPIFTDANSRIRTGANSSWWTRTCVSKSPYPDSEFYVTENGGSSSRPYYNNCGVLPCIRFA